jgi:NlpC/P60 family putative phage cell wall peptidase
VWSARDASVFAREGYAKNAIAYRCVRMIAEAAASAPLRVGPASHPLARLLARPNLEQTGIELLESFYGHLQVAGNAFLEAAALEGSAPAELYVLRPDRMSVVPGADGWPIGWEHRAGASVRRFERDLVTGEAPILHLKLFHPADDCLGLVRGVWRALNGEEPEAAPAYTPDWAERKGEETLLAAARRHLVETSAAAATPGDVLLFRMDARSPIKHAAFLDEDEGLIHAYWGRAVVRSRFAPWWRARWAAAFSFPGATPWPS